jgi:hypothetical protein
MRPSSFQLSSYTTIHVAVHLIYFRILSWASILENLLLIRKLMINLLKIFVTITGVLDLLLLFRVLTMGVYWIWILVTTA